MLPIRDRQSSNITPFITWIIIGINAFVLIIEFAHNDLNQFFDQWALIPIKINFTDIATLYPFITSVFLHGGLVHFLSNMWFLRIFGDNVEGYLGYIKYLLFYLGGGIIAGLAQYMIAPNSNIPMIGASGAIAAVLGFYIIVFPHHTVDTLIPSLTLFTISLPAQIVLGMWFITQLFNGTAAVTVTSFDSGIAWWAHIGGFLYGVILAKLLIQKPKYYVS